ncbi:MAG: 50S ribosomal protein L22 [Candidatus Pacearchaeota archaeon]|nr:50S ribosomal protein L22 [Candidatus Pacearchaeota archaeon]
MNTRASVKYIRIAPRKVRLVADLIRNKKASDALTQLQFTTKKGADPIRKLLNSAIASAQQQYEVNPSELKIVKITVDEGPKLKRWRARARGAAYQIQKKSSHISLELEIGKAVKKTRSASPVKAEEPVEVEKKTGEARDSRRPDVRSRKAEQRRGGVGRIFRRKVI